MITINLKPGAKRAVQKGKAFAGLGPWLRGVGQKVREPGLAVAGVAWLVVLLFFGVVLLRTSSQLRSLEPELRRTKTEYRNYQNFVGEKHREERVRDTILAQIGTISAVDQDRYVWPHILDEIAAALPDFTWLTSVAPIAPPADAEPDSTGSLPVNIRIVGRTSGLENYTAFLRRLEDSPWLTNVLPVEAKTVIEANQPLTNFTVQATFSRADSSRIHTVPILESTVR